MKHRCLIYAKFLNKCINTSRSPGVRAARARPGKRHADTTARLQHVEAGRSRVLLDEAPGGGRPARGAARHRPRRRSGSRSEFPRLKRSDFSV